jgi:transcriptional regulator with XRE-family HTH domain
MPKRHEKDPHFGGRIAEVRVRLGCPERKSFADERLRINSNTYQAWEQLSVTPSMRDLKRAIKNIREPGTGRPLADWQALVIWLADGQDNPPPWLRDPKMHPYERGANLVAFAPAEDIAELGDSSREASEVPAAMSLDDDTHTSPEQAISSLSFGERLRAVRARLGFKVAIEFAGVIGVNPRTYPRWERHTAVPAADDLARAVRNMRDSSGRPLYDWTSTLAYLATGTDEPAWLRNADLDPCAPPTTHAEPPRDPSGSSSPGSRAIPVTLLIERIGSVAPVLRRAATRELQDAEGRGDLGVVEVATAFEKFYRELRAKIAKPPAPGQPAPGPAGGAFESGSNLLRWIEREVDAA